MKGKIDVVVKIFTCVIASITLVYSLLSDFKKIEGIQIFLLLVASIVILLFALALTASSRHSKTEFGLFKAAAAVGCSFFLIKFGVLFIAYYGLYLISTDAIRHFYLPAIVFSLMALYPVYFSNIRKKTSKSS
jgi:amino acid transporter